MKNDLPGIFRGAVDIEISGRFSERFLNLAFQEGIELSRIHKKETSVVARVPLDHVHQLRDIARRSHCAFRIHRRVGLPFTLAFLRRRPLLPLAAAAAVFLLSFISSFIFSIEVGGPYPVLPEDGQKVLQLAAEAGVEPGRSRWGVDLEAAEQYILLNFSELVFVEIAEQGVHLMIKVVKRVDVAPEDAVKPPGNLVAACDGIIEDVLVRQGTAAVKSGDAVSRGDILIYGWQGGAEVAANGIVTANLWGEGYGECAELEEGSEPSGRTAIAIGVQIDSGPLLHLAGAARSPYEMYRVSHQVARTIIWRKTGPTVEVIFTEIGELLPFSIVYTPEEARLQARTRAKENAYENLLRLCGAADGDALRLTATRIEDIALPDGLARAHAVCEGRTEIGVYQQAAGQETQPPAAEAG
ncbi:MAG: sporulation protein YqfD [Clostridia bacterium]|nr:sporulation protein YqfD [Clostridia bacterium]